MKMNQLISISVVGGNVICGVGSASCCALGGEQEAPGQERRLVLWHRRSQVQVQHPHIQPSFLSLSPGEFVPEPNRHSLTETRTRGRLCKSINLLMHISLPWPAQILYFLMLRD